MKNIVLCIAITATTLAACNSTNTKSSESQNGIKGTQANSQTDNASAPLQKEVKNTVSIKEIVRAYLQMKNAFTEDNSTGAATAGKKLEAAFKSFDKSALTSAQKKSYKDVEDDAREHAEHIGANGGNIAHQREHFALLSKDMYDLVKSFGSEQVLYKVFDSMVDNGKGAFWLSETKEIKNPYMGKAMLSSGTIQEEIK